MNSIFIAMLGWPLFLHADERIYLLHHDFLINLHRLLVNFKRDDFIKHLVHFLVVMVWFWVTRSYNIHNFVLIFDGVDPPIFYHELKLSNIFTSLFFGTIPFEAVTHDGDEHIQHVDAHKETEEEEEH